MLRGMLTVALAVCALWTMPWGLAEAQRRADAGTLVKLGSFEVDLTRGQQMLDVTGASGRFKELRLYAKRNPIVISRVRVAYGNGQMHNEQRTINLRPGERTRPIDPRSEGRFVDRLELTYQPSREVRGEDRIAVIDVYGLQTSQDARAQRPATGGAVVTKPTAPAPETAAPGTQTRHGIFLGRQSLGFGVDRDRVRVGPDRGEFGRIRLRVLEHAIHLVQLRVIYADGEPDILAYDANIESNSRTDYFKLKGDREIREVEVVYRKQDGVRGRATVEVYGEFSEAHLAKLESLTDPRRWVFLDAQSAALKIGFDRDTFAVPRNRGYTKIRVDVRERAITLKDMTLVFDDQTTEVYNATGNRTRVSAGGSFTFDLKGTRKRIKELRVTYRSRFLDRDARGRDAAVVELWGRY